MQFQALAIVLAFYSLIPGSSPVLETGSTTSATESTTASGPTINGTTATWGSTIHGSTIDGYATTASGPTINGTTAIAESTINGTTAIAESTINGTTATSGSTTVSGSTIDGYATTASGPTINGTTTTSGSTIHGSTGTTSFSTTAATNASIVTSTTTAHSTTIASLLSNITLFECDFSKSSCFTSDNDSVIITNGNEFAVAIKKDSKEPRAPVSSAKVMTKRASGSELCKIPYNVSFFTNTSINWNMWFCFEDKCLSNIDNKTLNCSSGKYSLIPFKPGDLNKTISINVPSSNGKLRSKDSQCLYYYYYITPLNTTLESNARIQVYMIDNNTELSISIATDVNTTQNSWQKSYVDIASSTGNYTVEFRFEYNIKDLETNETIYFALDDITVYDANCKHVREIKDTNSTTTTISSLPNKPDVGLALGFGLGLGLPFIFLIVLGSFCYMKKCRHKNTNNEIITKSYTSRTSINPYDYYDIQTTYF